MKKESMKKKLSLIVVLVIILSFAAAGCGGSGSTEGDVAVGDPFQMPISGVELPAPEPYSFTLAAVRDGGLDAFGQLVDQLNEIPNCTASTKWFSADDLDTQINMALTAGAGKCPYDLFNISLRLYREYSANGWLMPLDDYISKYEEQYEFSDIPKATWEALQEDGTTYGIPTSVNVQHLFYRADLFEKHNLEAPRTMEDLIAICEVLKNDEEIEYPLALAMGKGNGSMTEFVNAMYGLDAEFFDENNQPIFNNADGVKAVELLKKLYSYMPPAATTYSNDDVMVLMQTGKIAITNTWSTRAQYMDDPTVSKVVGKIAYSAAPLVEEGKLPYTNLSPEIFVIPANISQDKEAIFLSLAEITSYEAQKSLLKSTMSTRTKSLTDSPEIIAEKPNMMAINDTVQLGASTGTFYPYFGSISSILGTYVAQAIDGTMTTQDALDQAAKECIVVLQDSGYIKK